MTLSSTIIQFKNHKMKRIIVTITIALCGMVLLPTQKIAAQSTSDQKAFERGMVAYNNKKFTEALPYLKQAATAGISGAYKPLVELYAKGDYNGSGKGNYKEAFTWLLIMAQRKYLDEGSKDKELAVLCLAYYDPLCFLFGDYKETIDHTTMAYKMGVPKTPYLMAQVAASYLKLGKISKANEWLDNAMLLATEKNDKYSIHTINAIRSKIALDKEDYFNAFKLSEDAASEGKVALAAYVYGVTLIKTKNHPEIGQKWVKLAAEYDYGGFFEINCFEGEIKRYWNTIKALSF